MICSLTTDDIQIIDLVIYNLAVDDIQCWRIDGVVVRVSMTFLNGSNINEELSS